MSFGRTEKQEEGKDDDDKEEEAKWASRNLAVHSSTFEISYCTKSEAKHL